MTPIQKHPYSSKSSARLALPVVALFLCFLAGCSSRHQDIQQWMDQQQRATSHRVAPIPEPTPFVPAAYTQAQAVDPFGMDRLTQALRSQKSGNDALLQVELNRRKEPLEAFTLGSMAMVGSIKQKGREVALIKANNLIYQIQVGNYLGQDYGKVIKITENQIDLREIVQDGSGEWIERNATLQLQESQGKSR
ncbi:MAG: pilus assembly protein PilP [Burkholderiaceae bacterium]|jgi:type IV pilus assembly protein PilP|nr:pilus assembly protein PilP [Burkholderiaceae bacterium]